MTSTEQRYYRALRTHWNLPAGLALQYAKDRAWCQNAGITFEWEPEQENPRDVFGEPDPINGPFYDPDAEFESCLARGQGDLDSGDDRERKGPVLASLGMIDGAHNQTGFSGYWFMVECELALEAKQTLIAMLEETHK